jgi:hypothetical protein
MGIIFPDGAEEKEQAAPDVQRSKLRSCLCLRTIIIISISGYLIGVNYFFTDTHFLKLQNSIRKQSIDMVVSPLVLVNC